MHRRMALRWRYGTRSRAQLNSRSNKSMSWRLYFLMAFLMIAFASAHIFALQKLNAMQAERPATIDLRSD
jgi:hypothetical protein